MDLNGVAVLLVLKEQFRGANREDTLHAVLLAIDPGLDSGPDAGPG